MTRALEGVDGVSHVWVNLASAMALVGGHNIIAKDAIEAIEDMGYEALVSSDDRVTLFLVDGMTCEYVSLVGCKSLYSESVSKGLYSDGHPCSVLS